jgi:hypothetical protein
MTVDDIPADDDAELEHLRDIFRAMTASPKQALGFITRIPLLANSIGEPDDYAETLEDAVGELLEAWTELEDEREEVTNQETDRE